jgi:putative two-component system response regulator
VDDTPANLKLLSGMLAQRGYKARPVPNGTLALQAVRSKPPDLILLDINMPGLNGYEVCRQLKADEKLSEIPVIFLSALGETEDKLRAFAAGGVDYISKPFQFEEVDARIATHLKLRHLQQQLEEHNQELSRLVQEQVKKISDSQLATIFALAKLAESRDEDTGRTSSRVRRYAGRWRSTWPRTARRSGGSTGSSSTTSTSRAPCTTSARSRSPTRSS